MEKAGKAKSDKGKRWHGSFWGGEEGDASHSYPLLSISNSTFSPHQLSAGLLPPLPDTFPWLHSIYGTKSSSLIWHEGSLMMTDERDRIWPSLALTISSLFTLSLAFIDPTRGQAVSQLLAFAHAGSFCLECPALPSPPPHRSQQASFKPWQASPPW